MGDVQSTVAGLQRPLATVIVFDLTAAVPPVLLFLPAMIATLTRSKRQEGAAA